MVRNCDVEMLVGGKFMYCFYAFSVLFASQDHRSFQFRHISNNVFVVY